MIDGHLIADVRSLALQDFELANDEGRALVHEAGHLPVPAEPLQAGNFIAVDARLGERSVVDADLSGEHLTDRQIEGRLVLLHLQRLGREVVGDLVGHPDDPGQEAQNQEDQ